MIKEVTQHKKPVQSAIFPGLIAAAILYFITGSNAGFAISAPSGDNPAAFFSSGAALPDERVLLETDRGLYLCGEKIAFTAFTLEGSLWLPIKLSRILYVELYNKENRVVSRGKYIISDGKSSGELVIPRTISTDYYYLRAYTRYMQNFGPAHFFLQRLRIVNPFYDYKQDTIKEPVPGSIKCTIMPDGGRLVMNLINTVGCRFTDKEGNGVNVNAAVTDETGKTITTFHTVRDGFAAFSLAPDSMHSYFIETEGIIPKVRTPLPLAAEHGITISSDTIDGSALRFRINSRPGDVSSLSILAQHGGVVFPVRRFSVDPSGYYSIPLADLPEGLISLVFISGISDTLLTRNFYIPYEKNQGITITTERQSYGKREDVRIRLKCCDPEGKPVSGDISFFTVIAGNAPDDRPASLQEQVVIQEFISLISDYDLAVDAASDPELLRIMLLSPVSYPGKMIRKSIPQFLPETRGDIITGKLLYSDNKPAAGIEVIQSFIGKYSRVEPCITANDGSFTFVPEIDHSAGDMIISPVNPERETIVSLDDEFSSEFLPHTEKALRLKDEELDFIKRLFINIQVDDAFREEKPLKESSDKPAAFPFYGDLAREYRFSDYAKLPNMKEFIFEILQGVVTARENKKDVINLIDERNFTAIGSNPLIMIDGIPVREASVILGLDPEKVQYVRVIRDKYYYRRFVFDGILDITTYKGDASSLSLPAGSFRYSYLAPGENKSGYSINVPVDNNSKAPVYKNLIRICPDVHTGEDGTAETTFITPDNSGAYRIRCFGILNNGLIVEGEAAISVNEQK